MNRSFAALAAGLAMLGGSTLARAGDQTHKFLHNDFDKTHCWPAVLAESRGGALDSRRRNNRAVSGRAR